MTKSNFSIAMHDKREGLTFDPFRQRASAPEPMSMGTSGTVLDLSFRNDPRASGAGGANHCESYAGIFALGGHGFDEVVCELRIR